MVFVAQRHAKGSAKLDGIGDKRLNAVRQFGLVGGRIIFVSFFGFFTALSRGRDKIIALYRFFPALRRGWGERCSLIGTKPGLNISAPAFRVFKIMLYRNRGPGGATTGGLDINRGRCVVGRFGVQVNNPAFPRRRIQRETGNVVSAGIGILDFAILWPPGI